MTLGKCVWSSLLFLVFSVSFGSEQDISYLTQLLPDIIKMTQSWLCMSINLPQASVHHAFLANDTRLRGSPYPSEATIQWGSRQYRYKVTAQGSWLWSILSTQPPAGLHLGVSGSLTDIKGGGRVFQVVAATQAKALEWWKLVVCSSKNTHPLSHLFVLGVC